MTTSRVPFRRRSPGPRGLVRRFVGGFVPALVAATVAALAPSAPGQVSSEQMPAEFEGVGITERLGDEVPLSLVFRDEQGVERPLSDYFRPERPVILTLNYYRCPMLCTLTLNGLVEALKELEWEVGREFEIVTVSINPDEGPELAAVKKKGYLSQYRRPTAEEGWHFLTGEQDAITRLADAIGFGYRFDERSGEFAHTSSITFVTPGGRISRYMNDVVFEPRDVRLALVEASEGTIGSPVEKFLLFTCFRYDPDANSYAVSAVKLMRLGGALTALVVALALFLLWTRGTPRNPAGTLAPAGPSLPASEIQS